MKEARLESGCNLEEIAGLLEISAGTLRAYENGIRKISVSNFYEILQIYNCDNSIIFFLKVEKK